MRSFAILLAVVVSMAGEVLCETRGYMELKLGDNDSSSIGRLLVIGDGRRFRHDLHMDGSTVAPGTYIGVTHTDDPLDKGCDETGPPRVLYGYNYKQMMNPMNITVYEGNKVAPSVEFDSSTTLTKGSKYSIMDRPIVFYKNIPLTWPASKGFIQWVIFQERLKDVAEFCGYFSEKPTKLDKQQH